MNKKQAGALGGKATFSKYGREHMSKIGASGARNMWQKYTLVPYGISQFAIVERATGRVKSIRSG